MDLGLVECEDSFSDTPTDFSSRRSDSKNVSRVKGDTNFEIVGELRT